ncbi:hypothetical protein SARC_01989 [Sphaeroforma arctica JP610]|uniref:GRIP domain-containing protein n=1 Tax=Sphaeroforma arctica JP610 TaxID=667725 RepID=A0A0L0GC49_9EUKA|nr:hypothetical protein SARC_01989 [Sphaeroforma arctica JP610]KNC85843.1 hypothetical protein SARC_01989 [Sphaeroforma arctica JP610]|eukprot:XP_014159745.1 hypothetical protein SARC_01989 [Sphaeroforma arctica JP610]
MAERLEALQAEVQEKEHIIQSLESTATSTLEARHTTISELDTLRRELQDAQTQHLEETAYQQQTIRNLKKKMVDLKRTLSKHVRASTNQNGVNYPDLPGTDSAGSLNYPASPQMRGPNDDTYSPVYKPQTPRHDNDDQIDRTATPDAPDVMYLKNVILKFLTARSVERKQLVPVLATILNFSANESQLARSSLEKKWFST